MWELRHLPPLPISVVLKPKIQREFYKYLYCFKTNFLSLYVSLYVILHYSMTATAYLHIYNIADVNGLKFP